MTVVFDFKTVAATEFGVGLEEGDGQEFVLVPVDPSVQTALGEMAVTTRNEMNEIDDPPSPYEPSQKYASIEHLYLPLDNDMAANVRALHQANNLPVNGKVMSNPSNVFCYFARIIDGKKHRLTAVKRATTFKGMLKSRLVQFITDALRLVPDKVFKLDNDFDLLADDEGVSILRPSGFEFVGQLKEAILGAAPANVKVIQSDLPFVDFSPIQEYASKHPRAARYLASIRVQKEARNVDKASLLKLCENTGVKVQEIKGKLIVDDASVMDFLGVLDRRLYQVELVKGSPESFRAANRRKIGSGS
jgi:Domain of unknown function (DUF4868)